MDSTQPQVRKVLSYVLPPLCSIIIGFAVYGDKVFQPHFTTFQFVIVSIEASILFNLLKDFGLRNTLAAALVIFIVNIFLVSKSGELTYILRDFLVLLAIFFSVYLFFRIFYKAVNPYLYPLAFGLLFALTYFIVISLLLIIYSVEGFWNFINMQLIISGLIGAGLGTGILLNDVLISKLKEKEEEETEEEKDAETE
jgi:hypothetical protein